MGGHPHLIQLGKQEVTGRCLEITASFLFLAKKTSQTEQLLTVGFRVGFSLTKELKSCITLYSLLPESRQRNGWENVETWTNCFRRGHLPVWFITWVSVHGRWAVRPSCAHRGICSIAHGPLHSRCSTSHMLLESTQSPKPQVLSVWRDQNKWTVLCVHCGPILSSRVISVLHEQLTIYSDQVTPIKSIHIDEVLVYPKGLELLTIQ